MIPALGVALGTILLRWLGTRGGPWTSWRAAIALPLAIMYVLTGLAHFTSMGVDLARFVPGGIAHPLLLVRIAGAVQILAGLGLLMRRSRVAAEACLIVLLAIKLPLNWIGAAQGLTVRGPLPTPPALRVPLVLLWMAVLVWLGRGAQAPPDSPSTSTPSRS